MTVDKTRIETLLSGLAVFDGLAPETPGRIANTGKLTGIAAGETLIC